MFGNIKVKYAPCKAVGQLKAAADYMLGKKKEQIKDGIVKTAPDLYTALGCEHDNFANNVLVTRKLNGKSYTRLKEKDILAHKMSISFHPDDNDKLNYQTAFNIAKEFAEKYFHAKGYEVLLAVHTDSEHIHAHFLISNCNMDTGKSYQRNQKDLHEMSAFFGEQCLAHGLTNSVRDTFYNKDLENPKDRICLAEKEMRKRGTESFKDELRTAIKEEIESSYNHSFDDVIKSLWKNWNIETRVKGNTVSYRHPEYKDKNGNLVSVRGSKLGDLFTVKGIIYELEKKYDNSLQNERGRSNLCASSSRTTTETGGTTDETRTKSISTPTDVGQPMGENGNNAGGGQARSRRQVPSIFDVDNNEPNVQSLDRFYDRYTKRAEDAERKAVEAAERARPVRKKRKSHSL